MPFLLPSLRCAHCFRALYAPVVLFLLSVTQTLMAQEFRLVMFYSNSSSPPAALSEPRLLDSADINVYLSNHIQALRESGYLEANLDTLRYAVDSMQTLAEAIVHNGPLYRIGDINLHTSDSATYSEIEKKLSRVFTNSPATRKTLDSIILTLQNDPAFTFDSQKRLTVQFHPQASAKLDIFLTLLPVIGRPLVDIQGWGNAHIKPTVLSRLVGLKVGDTISPKTLRNVERALNRLPYLQLIAPTQQESFENGVRLHIPIASRRANSTAGLLALNPDPITSTPQLAGNLEVNLVNLLRYGESFTLVWRGAAKAKHRMDLSVNVPVILASRWGVSADLKVQRNDTIDNLLASHLAVTYALNPFHTVALHANYSKAQAYTSVNAALPVQPQSASLALSYTMDLRTYEAGWESGSFLNFQAGLGMRNQGQKRGSLAAFDVHLAHVKEWGSRGVYSRVAFTTSGLLPLYESPDLLTVERCPLGGLQSVRGFYEEQTHTHTHATITLEPGWRWGRWLSASFFVDAALLEQGWRAQFLVGYGTALTFQTNLGHLHLAVAQGRASTFQLAQNDWLLHLGLRFRF